MTNSAGNNTYIGATARFCGYANLVMAENNVSWPGEHADQFGGEGPDTETWDGGIFEDSFDYASGADDPQFPAQSGDAMKYAIEIRDGRTICIKDCTIAAGKVTHSAVRIGPLPVNTWLQNINIDANCAKITGIYDEGATTKIQTPYIRRVRDATPIKVASTCTIIAPEFVSIIGNELLVEHLDGPQYSYMVQMVWPQAQYPYVADIAIAPLNVHSNLIVINRYYNPFEAWLWYGLTQSFEPLSATGHQTASAGNLSDAAHSINTTGKRAGKLVWEMTQNRMVRASGSAAADVWHVIDGSDAIATA